MMTTNDFLRKQKELMGIVMAHSGEVGTPALCLTALIVEASELLNEEGSFKWWKRNHQVNREKMVEEFVDILFFWLQFAIMLNITAEEIEDAYLMKHEKNVRRQLEGY